MITGIFIEECKNRFLCLVEIEGSIEECYVSSSSKLGNYISLKGRKVMLIENRGKKLRTKYTLQAVWIKRKWVLLNLNIINDLVLDTFTPSIQKTIHREYFIGVYKSDFYNQVDKEIIEAKGILSESETVCYPVVSCGRHLRQLNSFEELLMQGYKIRYIFVLMSPSIKGIVLNEKEQEVSDQFKKCVNAGMQIEFWTTRWYAGKCHLNKVPPGQISIT